MAKKAASTDRDDPKKNKSLAVRNILAKMPEAKYKEVAEAVKSEYGHEVPSSLFYTLKTKKNIKRAGRKAKRQSEATDGSPTKSVPVSMNSPATWVEAIKTAKLLLKQTGSVSNANALLKAVED